jgi:hypothetical protein
VPAVDADAGRRRLSGGSETFTRIALPEKGAGMHQASAAGEV